MKNLKNMIWPVNNGPRVDMWSDNILSHTFGYWENGSKAGPKYPPATKLELNIQPHGNYEFNPNSDEFYKFLEDCRKDKTLLNKTEYNKRFSN